MLSMTTGSSGRIPCNRVEPRSSGIRRVHFDIDGYPVLDLTEDKDLDPRFRRVSTRLVVKG